MFNEISFNKQNSSSKISIYPHNVEIWWKNFAYNQIFIKHWFFVITVIYSYEFSCMNKIESLSSKKNFAMLIVNKSNAFKNLQSHMKYFNNQFCCVSLFSWKNASSFIKESFVLLNLYMINVEVIFTFVILNDSRDVSLETKT